MSTPGVLDKKPTLQKNSATRLRLRNWAGWYEANYLLWIPVNLLYWERCWKANSQRENVATFRRVPYLYRARSGNIWGTTDYPHWQFMYVVVGSCVRWHSKRSQFCGWNSGGFYDMWIKLGSIGSSKHLCCYPLHFSGCSSRSKIRYGILAKLVYRPLWIILIRLIFPSLVKQVKYSWLIQGL